MGIFGHMTSSNPVKPRSNGDDTPDDDHTRHPAGSPGDHSPSDKDLDQLTQSVDKKLDTFSSKVDSMLEYPSASPSDTSHFTIDASPTRNKTLSPDINN